MVNRFRVQFVCSRVRKRRKTVRKICYFVPNCGQAKAKNKPIYGVFVRVSAFSDMEQITGVEPVYYTQ